MNLNYIFDIDGTLANCDARVYLHREKRWDEFYDRCLEDTPIVPVVELCRALLGQHSTTVFFFTNRPESVRVQTNQWLARHLGFGSMDAWLYMRKSDDFRPDTEVKPEFLAMANLKPEQVAMVFEDRNRMIQKWRSLGIMAAQVAEGEF